MSNLDELNHRDGGGWVLYFDEQNQHHYLFNESSQESLWCDSLGGVIVTAETGDDEFDVGPGESSSSHTPAVNLSLSEASIPSRLNSRASAATVRPKGVDSRRKSSRRRKTSAGRPAVHGSVLRPSWWVTTLAMVHTVAFEGPVTAAEATVRGLVFAVSALLVSVYFACDLMLRRMGPSFVHWAPQEPVTLKWAVICLREACLCFAVALSMLVPGLLAAYAYRELFWPPRMIAQSPSGGSRAMDSPGADDGGAGVSNDLGEWQLQPLPSVLGVVDMRRFFSICTFGYGVLASNNLTSLNGISTVPRYSNRGNQDSWAGPLVYIPADVVDLAYELVSEAEGLDSKTMVLEQAESEEEFLLDVNTV